jgi:hypothetical protein
MKLMQKSGERHTRNTHPGVDILVLDVAGLGGDQLVGGSSGRHIAGTVCCRVLGSRLLECANYVAPLAFSRHPWSTIAHVIARATSPATLAYPHTAEVRSKRGTYLASLEYCIVHLVMGI